ncbi:MAG: hypothetical protein ACFCVK_20290 [Acidimicrobiales bacterium]
MTQDELLAAVARMEDRFDDLLQRISIHTWEGKEAHRLAIDEEIVRRRQQRVGPRCIGNHLAQVYSQGYEDAIIAEIFDRIGPGRRRFLEIGVETGDQCNTRLLLETGWTGVWIEGDRESAAAIRTHWSDAIADGRLVLIDALVTRENLQDLIDGVAPGEAFDLVSVDIDYNTSHAWRALTSTGRVACIEYNASYPPVTPFEVEYHAEAVWTEGNYFGASLSTMQQIGEDKGMVLVGCDLSGVNAFFVDRAEAGHFAGPFTAEHHYEPARYPMLKHRGHPRRSL